MGMYLIIAIVAAVFLALIIGDAVGSARTYSEMVARHHAIESSRLMADFAKEIVTRRSISGGTARLIGDGGNHD